MSDNQAADRLVYRAMIGTGGIGHGAFFALDGNHTLGREESRSGRFLDRRDYCKLHIIAHYVKALLGPAFAVLPVGQVGDDGAGHGLLGEMAEAGLDCRYVGCAQGRATLFGLCFIYPDGSGGNLTANDSACAAVDAVFVAGAEPAFAAVGCRGIALAAPEVPLPARVRMLELGTRYGCLRVASFTSAEIPEALSGEVLARVDLLALNIDEAAALAAVSTRGQAPEKIVEAAVEAALSFAPSIRLSITAGKLGSWSWDGSRLAHLPIFGVPVASTAGAGDAHLSGILAGLATGAPLAYAQELGGLVAALSVTSPHTINKEITPAALRAFAATAQPPASEDLLRLLDGLGSLGEER